ncbi:phage tail assembly protein [Kitasatospora sp. NPDC057940]|uniref:phage tail assembly protein n=1 Tax=Kitasatospora sp. NPDC057940 TaxID=3346285 RepID=UPI0036DA5017
MAQYSLDDIRAAAESKYGSTDITIGEDVVRLLNPLRLPKAKREELTALQDRLGEDDADQEELLSHAIKLVAEHAAQAKKLLTAVSGDLAVLAEIFDRYAKGAQVGEASASQG